MEPLDFLIAILGVGGLGALIKTILNYLAKKDQLSTTAAADAQEAFNDALQKQRSDFEKFLGSHMEQNRRGLEALVHTIERMGDQRSREHTEIMVYMREQARVVRDGHIKMGQLLTASRQTGDVGRVLDEVMTDIENREKENGR